MKDEALRIPYGREALTWSPPADLVVTCLEKPEPEPLDPPESALGAALDQPLNSPPLEELARGARRITIVITDATRPCPDRLLVGGIADRLGRAGIPDRAVTLLVALGMHRPSTPEERLEKLGSELLGRFSIVDSAPLDPARLISLGTSPDGVPAFVDRAATETDLLVSTGIVEPHQYAGFSGGWKTVAVGAAGAQTISTLHGMRYLDDPDVRLGETASNPFLDAARWIGEKAGLKFAVNVALDSPGRPVAVAAGHPEAVHGHLVDWVRTRTTAGVATTFPIVIGAAGHPKDSNLYQATRIPTYLCLSRMPVVQEGGFVIVPAACPEGAGQGPGERNFLEWMSAAENPDALIERARGERHPAGVQRAVMVARAMKKARIVFVGAEHPEVVTACGFKAFASLEDAVHHAVTESGERRILVVPRALTTLVEFTDSNRRGGSCC